MRPARLRALSAGSSQPSSSPVGSRRPRHPAGCRGTEVEGGATGPLVGERPIEQLVEMLARPPRGSRRAGSGRRPGESRRRSPARRGRTGLGLPVGALEALAEHQLRRPRAARSRWSTAAGPRLSESTTTSEAAGRFLGDDLGEAGHRRRQSLAQAGLRAIGDSDPRGDLVDDRVEGGEEAVLLALEVLVEGRLRDAGEPDQLAHRGLGVAVSRDRRDHRPFEPPALVAFGVARARFRRGPPLSVRKIGSGAFSVLMYAA